MKIQGRFVNASVVLLSCSLFWSEGNAADFSDALRASSYHVYSGDVNGDGLADLLLTATTRVAPLHFDEDAFVLVPLPSPTPTFVLLSGPDGKYTLDAAPAPEFVGSSQWQEKTGSLAFASIQGNGIESMFIEAPSPGAPSFLISISSTGEVQLRQQLGQDFVGVDLGAPGMTVQLKDNNADGRADLLVMANGRLALVLVGDANGILRRDDAATISAVWRAMLAELDHANKDGALAYFDDRSKPAYGSMFTALGEQMKSVSPTLSSLRFVLVTSRIAEAVLTRTFNGQTTMHFVTFVAGRNGWVVMEL